MNGSLDHLAGLPCAAECAGIIVRGTDPLDAARRLVDAIESRPADAHLMPTPLRFQRPEARRPDVPMRSESRHYDGPRGGRMR